MKRNLQITPKEPTWKQGLMNSPVLTAKPDEKGYLPSYLDAIYPGGREAMMPGGMFYRMFNVCLNLKKVDTFGNSTKVKMKGRTQARQVYNESVSIKTGKL